MTWEGGMGEEGGRKKKTQWEQTGGSQRVEKPFSRSPSCSWLSLPPYSSSVFPCPEKTSSFILSTHTDTHRPVVAVWTVEFVSSVKVSELRPGWRTTRLGWRGRRCQLRSSEVSQASMAEAGLLGGAGELGGTPCTGSFLFPFLPLNWAQVMPASDPPGCNAGLLAFLAAWFSSNGPSAVSTLLNT